MHPARREAAVKVDPPFRTQVVNSLPERDRLALTEGLGLDAEKHGFVSIGNDQVGPACIADGRHDMPAAPKAVAPAQPSKLVTASWYGSHHHGRRTASGETFDATAFTAAHRTLPFGTLLAVTNPENGRTAMVRVNDRGPFMKGRALDLSEAAARAIGVHAKGATKVMVIHPEK